MNTLKFCSKAARLQPQTEDVKENAAEHYRREVDYYKMILNLKRDTGDVKQSYVYKIKQLTNDNERLSALEISHKSAIMKLKRENELVKNELNMYKSIDRETVEALGSNKLTKYQSSQTVSKVFGSKAAAELGKTLDFKSKFNETQKVSLFTEAVRDHKLHSSSITESKLPPINTRTTNGSQTARHTRQGSLQRLSLSRGNSLTVDRNIQAISECKVSDDRSKDDDRLCRYDDSQSPVIRQLESPTREEACQTRGHISYDTVDMSGKVLARDHDGELKVIDMRNSVGSSGEERDLTPEDARASSRQQTDSFYANYLRFKNRIKELKGEISQDEARISRKEAEKRTVFLPIRSIKATYSPSSYLRGKELLMYSSSSRLKVLEALARSQKESIEGESSPKYNPHLVRNLSPRMRIEQRLFGQSKIDARTIEDLNLGESTELDSLRRSQPESVSALIAYNKLKQSSRSKDAWTRLDLRNKQEMYRGSIAKRYYARVD